MLSKSTARIFVHTCENCGSEFRYDNSAVIERTIIDENGICKKRFVKCPFCETKDVIKFYSI